MARLRFRISSVFGVGQQSTFIALHVKETLTNYFQFSIKVLRSESQVSFSTLL